MHFGSKIIDNLKKTHFENVNQRRPSAKVLHTESYFPV